MQLFLLFMNRYLYNVNLRSETHHELNYLYTFIYLEKAKKRKPIQDNLLVFKPFCISFTHGIYESVIHYISFSRRLIPKRLTMTNYRDILPGVTQGLSTLLKGALVVMFQAGFELTTFQSSAH